MNQLRRVSPLTYQPEGPCLHLIVEYLHRGRDFFKLKQYNINELNMHIPLPLQRVLMQLLAHLGPEATTFSTEYMPKMLGMYVVPGYENRIIISHPAYAFYDNEPLVVIELDKANNYPTYFEFN